MLGFYRQCPPDGVGGLLRRDGTGPADPHPTQDPGWAPQKRPERLRATYSKNGGGRSLFGAYDVHAGCLHGRVRPLRSGEEALGLYRQIRTRYRPKIRIHLIAANLRA
ncbi:MAG: hypothetical protein ACR2NR_13420 [Solirubrobacteraceae bacterium]